MRILVSMIATLAIGCGGVSGPAQVRVGEDACAQCRMTVLSTRTAAQIVTPGDEPVIFDEIGCLRDYLANHSLSSTSRVFVADHSSGEWIDAATAVFTKSAETTPMSSGLIAHANRASRDADPAAQNGASVEASAVLNTRQVSP